MAGVDLDGFKGMKGEVFGKSSCPTDSRFFQLFTRGLLLCLGRQTVSNWGLDYKILHVILNSLEEELRDHPHDELSKKDKRSIIMFGAFSLIAFVCALAGGNEIFLVESEVLQSMVDRGKSENEGKNQHVVIPLFGRF